MTGIPFGLLQHRWTNRNQGCFSLEATKMLPHLHRRPSLQRLSLTNSHSALARSLARTGMFPMCQIKKSHYMPVVAAQTDDLREGRVSLEERQKTLRGN